LEKIENKKYPTEKEVVKMRDLEFDLFNFEFQIMNRLRRYAPKLNGLRSKVVNNSNFTEEYLGFLLHNLKLLEFRQLCIAQWYFPEEISFMLRLDLEEYNNKFDEEERFINNLLLNSKTEMILFLTDTKLWHTRQFFGNIITNDMRVIENLSFRRRSKKVKEIQRKRGYHDHGSLKPKEKWLPSSDYTLTELQNQIEQKRETYMDTYQLTGGWLS